MRAKNGLGGWRMLGSVGVAAVITLTGTQALAAQVTIGPARDNTIYEPATDRSCGAGGSLVAGRTRNGLLRRALLQFDVAAAIPQGSTIHGVSLAIGVHQTQDTQEAPMTLHRVRADWGEGLSNCEANEGQGASAQIGDATWLHTFYDDQVWLLAGGDFDELPSATAAVGLTGAFAWTGDLLTADVQDWLDDPSINFGWVLSGDESSRLQTARRLGAREAVLVEDRPTLTVDFTPPSGAEACCTADASCVFAEAGACEGILLPGVDSCVPNACTSLLGACCLPDGSCAQLTENGCGNLMGSYGGPGSSCGEPASCGAR
jgi:hypothetical protein